jgi:undecaprenyl-diphosphatase
VLVLEVVDLEPLPGDRSLAHGLVRRWREPLFRTALRISHYAGGAKSVVALAAVVAAVLVLVRRPRAALFVALAVGVLAAVAILKPAIGRPPPPGGETRYSFPSGHAAGTLALAAAIVAVCRPPLLRWLAAPIAALYVVTIGVAVVTAEGHWPSDVLAGWLLAAAWLPLARNLAARLFTPSERSVAARRTRSPTPRETE